MSRPADPFDELRGQLERAAADTSNAAAPTNDTNRSQTRSRRPSRRVGLLASAAVLVTGTAVAATAPWNPTLGGDHGAEPPTKARSAVPASQTAALGVLRRAPTDNDRSPAVQRALRRLSAPYGAGVHVDEIRLLRRHADQSVLLVPFRRVGPKDGPPEAHIRNALCVFAAYIELPSTGPARPAGDAGRGVLPASSAACGSLADIRRGRVGTTTTGLVPDGVDRVRVVLTTGKVLTAKVTDNYYEFPFDVSPPGGVPGADPAAEKRFRMINGRRKDWLDRNGHIVPKIYR